MKKIFVLDTNVLLHDPKALFAFDDNEVVIPLVVLDELDKKKDGQDEVARHARAVIRALDEMRERGSLHEGVKIDSGGVVRVEINHKDNIPDHLDHTRADNRIVSVALGLQKACQDKVTLITKDINLRVKCDAIGVATEDYNTDSVADTAEDIYSGYSEIVMPASQVDSLHSLGFVNSGVVHKFYENQYILLRSDTNPKHTGLARFSNGSFIKIEPKNNVWGISPRNKEQAFSFDALFNPNIKLVTLIGRAGTGKTLIAAAAGISQLLDTPRVYRRVLMSRPIVPMGRDIGYLPGDINDKMRPWMAPLQDNLDLLFSEKGANYLETCREQGTIEVEALTYIRGRSIPKSYIIIDEAQQLTRHEIKTIITRVGEDSKVVLTGDIYQIDNPFIDAVDNGLSYVIEKFKNDSIAAHITLKKGERSDLATKASELL